MSPSIGSRVTLDIAGFDALLAALQSDGRELIGPTVSDDAIVLDAIRGTEDLPRGLGDEQAPGHYRLRERGDDALFGYAVPQHSFKRELLVPRVTLVKLRRSAKGLAIEPSPPAERRVAFVGIRACEIAAIATQDRVLRDGLYADADYASRRAHVFILAVQCGSPSGTCFCVSMGTGPHASEGFDLAATEVLEPEHVFIVEIGTEAGRAILEQVPTRPTSDAEQRSAEEVVSAAASRMGRAMDQTNIRDDLMSNLEHPRWDDVAERCLGCANCVMACPDVLLHERRGHDRHLRRRGDAHAAMGRVLHDGLRLPPWWGGTAFAPRPLSPVADAQGGDLARPVRYVRMRRVRTMHHLVPCRDRHHRRGRRDPKIAEREVTMEDLERSLRSHPFMAELASEDVRFLVGCAANVRFRPGDYLVREGEREDRFFLIRQGTVTVEMPRPSGCPVIVETVGPGDVLGVSRVAPLAAHLDARARDSVLAFALDNACIIEKMRTEPRFGYAITSRLLERTYDRLSRARLQYLDVYR